MDLSPEMLRVARSRAGSAGNVAFVRGDAADWPFAPDSFDVIVSINTLHHLDLASTVARLREALRPGGTLIVADVLDRSATRYLPLNALAALVRSLGRSPGRDLRRAYEAHGRDETYLTPSEARERWAALLPGAEVRHHLFWRYSVTWRKAV